MAAGWYRQGEIGPITRQTKNAREQPGTLFLQVFALIRSQTANPESSQPPPGRYKNNKLGELSFYPDRIPLK
jgi:hypothetical protein